MNALPSPIPVVVLYGPTAVGKTELLSALPADRYEIINADSRQVYRGLDIGTAKPDLETRRRIIHHLVDICDPTEQYAAGRFVRDADRLVDEIILRGRRPIVAGGTGYYLRNFIYGLPPAPASFPTVREKLRHETERRGIEAMYRELEEVDPITAARIASADRYRIERALEVWRGSGRPLSSYPVPNEPRSRYRPLLIRLDRPRKELYSRIDSRVIRMFADGLLDEVARVLDEGCPEDAPGLSSIGYAEIISMRKHGCATKADVADSIARNTRRYAKRQLTFFRLLRDAVVVAAEATNEASSLIEEHYRDAS